MDADDLAPLVELDVAADLDDGAAGELRLLDLERLLPVVGEEPVAGVDGPVELGAAAGDEHVDAAEDAPGGRPDVGRHRVAEHRRADDLPHAARRYLRSPAGPGAVVLGGEQRVVVAHAPGEVADRVVGRGRDVLHRLGGHVHADEQPRPLDVLILEDGSRVLLKLLLNVNHGSLLPSVSQFSGRPTICVMSMLKILARPLSVCGGTCHLRLNVRLLRARRTVRRGGRQSRAACSASTRRSSFPDGV